MALIRLGLDLGFLQPDSYSRYGEDSEFLVFSKIPITLNVKFSKLFFCGFLHNADSNFTCGNALIHSATCFLNNLYYDMLKQCIMEVKVLGIKLGHSERSTKRAFFCNPIIEYLKIIFFKYVFYISFKK